MKVKLIREVFDMPPIEVLYDSYRNDTNPKSIKKYSYVTFVNKTDEGKLIEFRKSKVVDMFGKTKWFKKGYPYVIMYDSDKQISAVCNLFGVWAFIKPNRIFYVELFPVGEKEPVHLNESFHTGKITNESYKERLNHLVGKCLEMSVEIIKRDGAICVDALINEEDQTMRYFKTQMENHKEGSVGWLMAERSFKSAEKRNDAYLKNVGALPYF